MLDELGAGSKPRITVFNKIDLLDADLRAAPMPASRDTAFVSATTGEGLDRCSERVADALRAQMVAIDTVVPYARGELVARAKASGARGRVVTPMRASGSPGHLPPAIAAEVRNAEVRATPRGRSA